MATTKKKEDAKRTLEEIANELNVQLPDEVKRISGKRAKEFLMILKDIGIGEIINAVVQEKRGDANALKPITADMQMNVAASSVARDAEKRIKEVQLAIDYQMLTERLTQGDVFDRVICAVLDTDDADNADFGRFGTVFPFFLSRFSRLYSGLTGFIVQSV